MKKVIAIDGPSGAGKSTVSREVARKLGFYYLDTGALYRAVAYHFFMKSKKEGSPLELSEDKIREELKSIVISYENGRVYLFSEDVTDLVRDPAVGELTSLISAKKIVRDFLLPIQRGFAEKYNTVAEGRDMTTVVFPDAWKKFYLDASPEVRAKRRYEQLLNLGKLITFEQALKDTIERDLRDSTREQSPLKIGGDVFYIDSSKLSIDEVISLIIKKVAEDD